MLLDFESEMMLL